MRTESPKIQSFLNLHYGEQAVETLELLSGGGSARKYYRFNYSDQTFILTESENVEENRTFIYFTEHFSKVIENLPMIYQVSEDTTLYVQSDFGNETLLDVVLKNPNESKFLYEKSIRQLVKMQVLGGADMDYSKCFSYPKFNHILVLRDLFLFKNYFLNLLGIEFNQGKLIQDFEKFSMDFEQIPEQYFVYRDFQTRNIMVYENESYFIDYQGGLKGPAQYDLVSILWQAKTDLPENWKEEFYGIYVNEFIDLTQQDLDGIQFRKGYDLCVLERLLQVLGTYGFRGVYQGKKHFIESIEFGLKNLEKIKEYPVLENYTELKKVILKLTEKSTFQTIKQIIDERKINR
ncbi:aminoglycoside phosphotransferase family protein [Moheibacter sediminis]|uniref:Predicted phosphotransferase, aminoglycoside/choline kinase (APH/ChoK) family n=1 Tax=Moheibacter sediminis TaxID=1434700 RepID=A0A1W1ZMZ7_9FLAO|nr:phosphotransferase [Moheibacter sediminis]SMC49799.1 Predicted phosphotransferase, aminoglycoside/choline kinase (APH/ChoK) family [Moheibacter sediminis]